MTSVAGLKPSTSELRPFGHPGQPESADAELRVRGEGPSWAPGCDRFAGVLDHQDNLFVGPGEPHTDVGVTGVLAHVAERLLRGPVQGQAGVGRHRPGGALDDKLTAPSRCVSMFGHELGQQVGARYGLPAQRGDRLAGLVKAGTRQPMRSVDPLSYVAVSAASVREQPKAVELKNQSGQGVGQYVMHLPSQAAAFGQRRRCLLRLSAALELGQQLQHLHAPFLLSPQQHTENEEEHCAAGNHQGEHRSVLGIEEEMDVEDHQAGGAHRGGAPNVEPKRGECHAQVEPNPT